MPDSRALRICGKLEDADALGLLPGRRALSVFVVNERPPGEQGRADEQFILAHAEASDQRLIRLPNRVVLRKMILLRRRPGEITI